MGYLGEDDKTRSSMRYNNRLVTYACIALMGVMGVYIVAMAIMHEGVKDWGGMAAFLGAIGFILTGIYSAKAYQKKHENGNIKH